jgi:protein gp37
MSKIGPYKVHPVADIFPLLHGEEFDRLVESIKQSGLQEPIVLSRDEVLIDGRNRYRACIKANVDPVVSKLSANYDEAEIRDYIINANLQRRHLNPGQAAIIAIDVEPFYAAEAKERMRAGGNKAGHGRTKVGQANWPDPIGQARDQVATIFGVSGNTISRAKKVKNESPLLAAAVLSGSMSMNEAYKQVRAKPKPPREQKAKSKADVVMLTLETHLGQNVPYQQPASKPTFNRTNDQSSWAAWSWNPVTGCIHGCRYCYARELALRPSYKDAYPVGFTPLFHHERLDAPTNTEVPEEAKNDPRMKRVFVCSMADLYGKWVPQEWIDQVHTSCIANPQWDYLMLTKFPRRYVGAELPPTAWIGTSVDEQKRVRPAEDAFRQIKGVRVKWLSLEPLLEPLEFTDLSMFDWIVIGSQTETEQPDGVVSAFAPPFEWVARLVAQAKECGARIYLKPNLLGDVGPQSPGMQLIQEEPLRDQAQAVKIAEPSKRVRERVPLIDHNDRAAVDRHQERRAPGAL